ALQLGFAVFLWLDTFPMIAGAMTLGLLPASLWSRRDPVVIDHERARWRTAVAVALIAYTLVLNAISLDRDPSSLAIARPAELIGIPQNWSMFAPSPSRLDGWF